MAERRMFAKRITDDDAFTAMPPTAQCLYFHLCMSADDDGFSNNIRIAMFNAHASTDDFNTLVNKKFIIPFESGVIVIRHWRMHNYIQSDRYHETKYLEEKSRIVLTQNGMYTECIQDVYRTDTQCIQNGYKMDNEVSIDKNSIDKNNINNNIRAKSADVNAFFDSIWELYPKKKGKGKVSDAKKRVLYDYGFDVIKRCIERYKSYIESEHMDEQFIMHGSTFFNSGYVDYLDTNCDDEDAQNNVRKYPDSWSEEDIRIFESAQVTTRR